MPATLDANCWTTLADFKEHLDIDASDTSKDNFLTNILNAAYKAAVNYIGQDLNETEYTEYYDGDGTDSFLLDNYPVTEIASIHDDVTRAFDSTTLIAATDYVFYASTGKVRKIQATSGQYITIGLVPSPLAWQSGVQNIKVVYTAGYSDVPYDAQRAVILIAAWYAQRAGSEGRTNETLGGRSVGYETYSIPLSVRQLLLPYKKFST